MRAITASSTLGLGLIANLVCACGAGAGTVANAVRPKEATAMEALGEPTGKDAPCHDVSRAGRPLVVDLKPEQRGDLEVAMGQGIAVVKYSCEGLELLSDCRAEGSYGFKGVVLKQQVIRLADADEVRANLPLSGAAMVAKIGAELERGSSLDLATALVGNYTSTRMQVARGELEGMCDGATHFVRGANAGAFVMQTGSQAEAATAAEIFGVGAGAGSQSSRSSRVEDGRIGDCEKATPDLDAPPGNCRALIRLHLVPVVAGKKAVAAAPPAKGAKPVVETAALEEETCPDGLVLSEGKCVAKEKAKVHVCKAGDAADCTAMCAEKEPQSCALLAAMHAKGQGAVADEAKAATLFEQACGLELGPACSSLGIFAAQGKGTAKDEKKAATLFEKACQLGDANGCFNLGALYYDGIGVTKDPRRAFTLFNQACDAGKAAGCINVGIAYDDGDGVEKDPKKAFALFKRACEGDDQLGCFNLAYMHSQGSGTAADQAAASVAYERACELGSAKGCEQIGSRYLAGNGVTADPAKANTLLQKACDLGEKKACGKVKPAP